jgi:2,3-bisphosphoglycerate-independent phosphoglycerate mutase
LAKAPALVGAFEKAKQGGGRLHFLGLVSDGGVHSHINHLFSLIDYAKAAGSWSNVFLPPFFRCIAHVHHTGVPECFVHAFTDGRDTPPSSAVLYIKQLVDRLAEGTGCAGACEPCS